MDWAPDVDTALALARRLKGADAHLVVIPNGISVMVREEKKDVSEGSFLVSLKKRGDLCGKESADRHERRGRFQRGGAFGAPGGV